MSFVAQSASCDGQLSSAVVTQSVSISIGAETTWDAAVRDVYNRSAEAIRAQAQQLALSGQMTADQAEVWVTGQRNALIVATRGESSPLGRVIADWIKPLDTLKGVADLKALGKTTAGIIESSGKTNPWVNTLAMTSRYAGPALLVVGLSFSVSNIASAPNRWQMAAREAGAWPFSLAFGWAGGLAGCELFGAVGAVVPVVGEVAGCAVGAMAGTIRGAVLGNSVGSAAGDFVYRALDRPGAAAAGVGGRGQ